MDNSNPNTKKRRRSGPDTTDEDIEAPHTLQQQLENLESRVSEIEKALNRQDKLKDEKKTSSEDPEKKKLQAKLEDLNIEEVKWSDVAGMEAERKALEEAVILPMRHLFSGKTVSWKGILLVGARGTGKTYLAKALATEAKSTFFPVAPSDLKSARSFSYIFEIARRHKPSIIFIDEIDWLFQSTSVNESESERRIKTALLVQMQGDGHDSESVVVLGATSSPWLLDERIRRCFEKRIYIHLPEEDARATMFKIHLGNTRTELSEDDIKELGRRTEGYSGEDIRILVKDAWMQPIRRITRATHFKKIRGPSPKDHNTLDDLWFPCSPDDPEAIKSTWRKLETDKLAAPPPVTMQDMLKSLATSKPTVNDEELFKLEKFMNDFGQEG